jgi:hypothetical protein
MSDEEMPVPPSIKTSAREPRKLGVRLILAPLLLGLVGFIVLIPSHTDFHSGPRQNESAAIGSLRTLNMLEAQYARTRREKSFACDLSLLMSTGKLNSGNDPTETLLTGVSSGYKFEIVGCEDAHGVASHYRATAVPLRRAETGIRAFCTDESGRLFYDPDGSAANCLAMHRPI